VNKIEKSGYLKMKVFYSVQTIHKFHYTLKNDKIELLAKNGHNRKIISEKKTENNKTRNIEHFGT